MAKLLLHVCCAPCLLGCIKSLKRHKVTLFFYNPNIHPSGEYLKRLFFVKKIAQEYRLPLIVGDYEFHEFFERSKGFEREKEGGLRCERCFDLRLRVTAMLAKEKRFDVFTTTMSVSPHKNFRLVKSVADKIGKEFKVKFLAKDFKKDDGFKRSVELSKRLKIYRQNYCGCIFSLNNKITQQ